jgi:hypothetical protein
METRKCYIKSEGSQLIITAAGATEHIIFDWKTKEFSGKPLTDYYGRPISNDKDIPENLRLISEQDESQYSYRYRQKRMEMRNAIKSPRDKALYKYLRNCKIESIDGDDKVKELVRLAKRNCGNGRKRALAAFIPLIVSDKSLIYDTYISAGMRFCSTISHPLSDYPKNIIKLLKLADKECDSGLENYYFSTSELANKRYFDVFYDFVLRENITDAYIIRDYLNGIIFRSEALNELSYLDTKALLGYLINYLEPFESLKFRDAITILRDYLSMANRIGRRVDRYPKYLRSMHDILTANYRAFKQTYDEIAFAFAYKSYKIEGIEYKYKDYVLVMPDTSKDVVAEGTDLGHCVSSYVPKIIEGKCLIMFLRKKDTPSESLVTLELNPNGSRAPGCITPFKYFVQYKGARNRAITEEENEAMLKIQEQINNPRMKIQSDFVAMAMACVITPPVEIQNVS